MGSSTVEVRSGGGLTVDKIKAIICISGKRKSGKDFVTGQLAHLIWRRFAGCSVSVCTLSNPLKEEFAELHGIDASGLKGDGPGKEVVREEMIAFGEQIRAKDPDYFCRKAFARRKVVHPAGDNVSTKEGEVVLVSDCRRPSDLVYFRAQFRSSQLLFVRVECPQGIRERRGFVFQTGIDDADSECALDKFGQWDLRIENDEQSELHQKLMGIVHRMG